jgi:hypothetical protein
VHAEFTVRHRQEAATEIKARLETLLGPSLPRPPGRSALARRKAPPGATDTFIGANDRYTIICAPVSEAELQVFVEPSMASITEACESAWRVVRKALRWRMPRVSLVEVRAVLLGRVVIRGERGLFAHLTKASVISAVLVGLTNLGLFIWGWNSFASDDPENLLIGTAPAMGVGLLYLLWAVCLWLGRRFRWRV